MTTNMVVSYRRICRYLVLLLKAAEKHVTLVVEGSQMFIIHSAEYPLLLGGG